MGLKLDGATLESRFFFFAAAAAEAKFSASCFAARSTALLFVRGAIEGLEWNEATLLGRGGRVVGLDGVSGSRSVSAFVSPFVAGASGALAGGIIPSTDDGRLTAYREGVVERDAGRAGEARGVDGEAPLEVVRPIPGSLGVVAPRTGTHQHLGGRRKTRQGNAHMNDEGGPCTPRCLSSALLLDLGETEGGLTDVTTNGGVVIGGPLE